jgi:hypothetical protein
MPSASEFSTDPNQNLTIGGLDVSEGCSPANINGALRYAAAVIRDSADKVPTVGGFVPSTGGTYTGDIFRQSRGAYLHHAGSGQTDGRVMFLPEGSARPAAAEGMIVFYY